MGETIERLILFVFLIGSNYFFSGKSKKKRKIHLLQHRRLFQNSVTIETVLINLVLELNARVLHQCKSTRSGASFRLKMQWKNMDTPIFAATATTTNLEGK